MVEKVRYDNQGTRVERVVIRPVSNGVPGHARVWPRSNLVNVLHRGLIVVVVPAGRDLRDVSRREVTQLSLTRESFIRVDDADEPEDFLGSLPAM